MHFTIESKQTMLSISVLTIGGVPRVYSLCASCAGRSAPVVFPTPISAVAFGCLNNNGHTGLVGGVDFHRKKPMQVKRGPGILIRVSKAHCMKKMLIRGLFTLEDDHYTVFHNRIGPTGKTECININLDRQVDVIVNMYSFFWV